MTDDRYRPPGKRFLSHDQEQIVRDALARGATHAEAAEAAGVSYRRLKTRLYDQLLDLRVGQGRREAPRSCRRDPTPEEIAVAAAGVRKKWTPDRWGLHSPDTITDDTRHGREARFGR
jgi:hypothetical protein